jgi:hypothetical protein
VAAELRSAWVSDISEEGFGGPDESEGCGDLGSEDILRRGDC